MYTLTVSGGLNLLQKPDLNAVTSFACMHVYYYHIFGWMLAFCA